MQVLLWSLGLDSWHIRYISWLGRGDNSDSPMEFSLGFPLDAVSANQWQYFRYDSNYLVTRRTTKSDVGPNRNDHLPLAETKIKKEKKKKITCLFYGPLSLFKTVFQVDGQPSGGHEFKQLTRQEKKREWKNMLSSKRAIKSCEIVETSRIL